MFPKPCFKCNISQHENFSNLNSGLLLSFDLRGNTFSRGEGGRGNARSDEECGHKACNILMGLGHRFETIR